ncbi:MAG: Inner spore coat protein H [Planctomycetes bacterium ADurb.Bin069]|nr:MAG: Inner spore coat protein H [Planctomycetes bacterium ADurb.Bin069]
MSSTRRQTGLGIASAGRRRGIVCAAVAAWCAAASADVVVSEIMYHDADPSHDLEFVEIHNSAATPVVLSGWTIRGGINFGFPEGAVLEGGAYAVIAHDPEDLAACYGVEAIGRFSGRLGNGGDAFELRDHRGRTVTSVAYSDGWPWPVLADGGGPSLERVDFRLAAADDPAAWMHADNGEDWRLVERVGHATATTYVFWLDAAGTCMIDDVRVTPIDNPAKDLVRNGAFDTDASTWVFTGTHSRSGWTGEDGRAAPGCLQIVATNTGSEGAGARFTLASNPTPWGLYRVSYYVKWVGGGRSLRSQFVGGGAPAHVSLLGCGTPGRANSRAYAVRPPVVRARTIAPELPRAGDAVVVTARIESEALPSEVVLTYRVNFGTAVDLPMTPAGAGLWSAVVPAQAANALVRYAIAVATPEGRFTFPPPDDPTNYFGFIVQAAGQDPLMPCAWLFIAPADFARLNGNPSSDFYVPAAIAMDGEVYDNVRIRYRGGSVRSHPKKFYKLKFNRGRRWNGQRTINLNAEYPDYSRIRTHIAHTLFAEAGVLASMSDFYRLYLNGSYQGVYLAVEDPEEPYLARQGRDDGGNLYKCYSTDEMKGSVAEFYSYAIYRKQSNQEGDRDDLIEFITSMNQLPQSRLEAYIEDHVEVDRALAYIAMNSVLGNRDWGHKNHYLFHDLKTGKWEFAVWDVDLVMGKDWDPNCTGVGGAPCGGVFCHQGGYMHDIVGAGAFLLVAGFIISVPKFSARYQEILGNLLQELFPSQRMLPWIDALYSYLGPGVVEEITKFRTHWCQMTETQYWGQQEALKRWVPLRTAYISSQIATPVSDVACAAGPANSIAVTWTPAAGYSRIRVLVDGKITATLGGAASSFMTAPLKRGAHEICVIGVNTMGRQSAPRCCGLTLDGLAPPAKLAAALAGAEGRPALRVTWENADAYAAVNVYLDRGDGFVPAATAEGDATEALLELGDAAGLTEVAIGVEGVGDGATSAMTSLVAPVEGPPVNVVVCLREGGGRGVRIFYDPGEIPGGAWDAIEVLANGAPVARFDPAQSPQSFVFEADGSLAGRVIFALRGAWRGIVSAAGAECEIDLGGGALFIRGDVNRDGVVNVSDAVRLLRQLFTQAPLTCADAADVNDDGRLDLADAAALLEWLFTGGGPPAPPFPEEGVDPTPDDLGCE